MRRTLMLVVVSATVLAGCQTAPTGKTWTPAQFRPDITCRPGAACSVWVNPYDDWVPRRIIMEPGSGERVIVWHSSWAFQNGGILFDEAGRKALQCEQNGPWTVVCKADPSMRGEFKYTIDILGWDPVDPWYVNR